MSVAPRLKPLYSLVVNAVPLAVFGINTTVSNTAATLVSAAYACLVVAWAILYRGTRGSRLKTLALLAVVSAVPAITVIGWIQPSLQHSRYVYWPSTWVALLLAAALQSTSKRSFVLAAFVILQVSGLMLNIVVYQDLFNRAAVSIALVREQLKRLQLQDSEVQLVGVPADPNGVMYFRDELVERMEKELPTIKVQSCLTAESCTSSQDRVVLRFYWDHERQILTPAPPSL